MCVTIPRALSFWAKERSALEIFLRSESLYFLDNWAFVGDYELNRLHRGSFFEDNAVKTLGTV